MVSRDCCVALPRSAIGLSAVCDCGISLSYSLTIFIDILPITRVYFPGPKPCFVNITNFVIKGQFLWKE